MVMDSAHLFALHIEYVSESTRGAPCDECAGIGPDGCYHRHRLYHLEGEIADHSDDSIAYLDGIVCYACAWKILEHGIAFPGASRVGAD